MIQLQHPRRDRTGSGLEHALRASTTSWQGRPGPDAGGTGRGRTNRLSSRRDQRARERAEAEPPQTPTAVGDHPQEDERHRLARELHDQMGQHLTALALGLKVVKDATPAPSPVRDRLLELQELTDLIGREVHHLALELRPTALDDLGLQIALGNYAEVWAERAGVEVDFQEPPGLDGRPCLPAAVETGLYRVVQEALTNVLKHTQARRVSVVLQGAPGHVVAVVEDDGHGFDAELSASATGANRRLGSALGMQRGEDGGWSAGN